MSCRVRTDDTQKAGRVSATLKTVVPMHYGVATPLNIVFRFLDHNLNVLLFYDDFVVSSIRIFATPSLLIAIRHLGKRRTPLVEPLALSRVVHGAKDSISLT